MPLEALLIPENLTDSDSDGIGGGTGCNFIKKIYCYIYQFIPRKMAGWGKLSKKTFKEQRNNYTLEYHRFKCRSSQIS